MVRSTTRNTMRHLITDNASALGKFIATAPLIAGVVYALIRLAEILPGV